MFTIPIDQIFTSQKLKDSFLEISSKSIGLDEVSYNEFKKELSKNKRALTPVDLCFFLAHIILIINEKKGLTL